MDTETKDDPVQQLEGNMMAWLIMTGIFFAVAVIIISYRPGGKWYFLGFFGIATTLLIVITIDYQEESNALREQGFKINRRLEWLHILILIAIGIAFIIMFQVTTHDHTVR